MSDGPETKEDTLRKFSATLVATTIAAALVAGCGSSSPSSSAASAPSGGATSSSGGAYGSYGGSSSSSSSSSSSATGSAGTLTTKKTSLGTILAYGPKDLTVYLFEADKGGQSACSAACASVWPPITGKVTAAGGAISADLGSITRSGGTKQVTYKGHPLYLYVSDTSATDTTGQGSTSFGAPWYVMSPSGAAIK
jgi:predicted lipoprotein with Yx(FWY)xxD motif